MEDSKGYLWFGTDRGACRFDGRNFEYYNSGNGLLQDDVFIIHEDKYGRIWFGTFAPGLCYMENDSIYPFRFNDILIERFPYKSVKLSIHISDSGELYLGDSFSNLIAIDTTGKITIYGEKKKNVFDLGDQILTSLHRDYSKGADFKKGDLGISYHDGLELKEKVDIFPKKATVGSHYALKYDEKTIVTVYDQFLIVTRESTEQKVFENRFDCISKDSKNRLWLGTRDHGVFIYQDLNFDQEIFHFLDGYTVTHVEEDFQGGFWCTTLSGGVFHISSLLDNDIYLQEMPSNQVFDLHCSRTGEVFVLYSDGQVWYRKNKEIIKVIDYRPHSEGEFRNIIFLDTLSRTLYTKYSYRSDFKKFDLAPIPLFNEVEPNTSSYLYFIDSKRDVYDFRGRGLYDDGKELLRKPINEYNKVNAIDEYNDTIWLATINGLRYLDNDIFKEYPQYEYTNYSVSDVGHYKNTWAYAVEGVGIVLKTGNEKKLLTINSGENSNKITALTFDEKGNLYFCTSRAVYVAKKFEDFKVRKISRQFIRADDIYKIGYDGNEIILGTKSGIKVLPTDKSLDNPSPPRSYINLFSINGNRGSNYDISNLSHNENNFLIEFKSIEFAENESPEFAWKFNKEGSKWNYTKNPSLYLDQLKFGKYELLMMSSVIPEIWSKSDSLTFVIHPPFWMRWYFIIIEFLIASGLIFGFVNWRLGILKKESERELALNREKNALEMRALRAQMNPHFIFNTLTAIQNLIQSDQKDKAEYFLVKFSHLLRMVVDRSNESFVKLSDELNVIKIYLELQNLRFGDKFTYDIIYPEGIDPSQIQIPGLIIQPFVENAIEHGLSKKESAGHLTLRIMENDGRLQIEIEDNGIGRKMAAELNAKKLGKHKSVGMNNVSQRLKIMNSDQSTLENEIEIEDLADDEGKANGTLVRLKLNYNS